ncbi:MAG: class II glutamine amidotransferase, partial [Gammaproteobacteria bacterium]
MCGIVGAIADRDVSGILLEGLKRLEYRGYDSAGIALIDGETSQINFTKTVGKVNQLVKAATSNKSRGCLGIAHTRWATHGKPTVANAHPHTSNNDIAIVHNGIIENFESLKSQLIKSGYKFKTQTDSETIAHLIHKARKGGKVSLLDAVKQVIRKLHGAYGICVMDRTSPKEIIAARSGSPLVVGLGIGENFVASDPLALGQVTDRFIYLEEGDIARVTLDSVEVWSGSKRVKRKQATVRNRAADSEKG